MKTEIDARVMSIEDARRVTERIRIQATNVRDGLEKLQEHVDAAKAGKAWEVLGYKSWTAYLADVMGEEPLRLSRDDRREVVELLAGEGMSIRGIANITGASVGTVHNDQVFNSEHLAGEGMSTRVISPIVGVTQQRVSQIQNEVASDLPPGTSGNTSVSAPSATSPESPIAAMATQVTGMDGKTYTRTRPEPAPEKPRRTPLPKTFTSAVLDVQRRLKTLRDLTTEDRWPANKNQVATMHGSDLERINDLLQEIRQSLSN